MLGTHGRHIKCEKIVTNNDFIICVTLARVYHKIQSAGSINYLKKISENIFGMYVLLFTILAFFEDLNAEKGFALTQGLITR